ncbi:nucleotide-diphospho-sugar transferase [Ilyonectria sp. MPI-CAGE-AT-0026]|nr:nucleotide-diphospho-sugar transferase [Ilyonectria sp. MPI-CAGE-AT-0026]
MVSSRLRLIAVAVILSIFLFYNFSNRYDYSYPKAQPWNGQSQAVTAGKPIASVDYSDSEVTVPTPTGAGRGAVRTQAAALDSQQEDLALSAELEAQKLSASASSYSKDHPDDKTSSTNGKTSSTSGSGSKPTSHKSLDPSDQDVDWSRFAYTQYVTDTDYLCNSVMIFETLHRLGSKADRVMMYPHYMLDPKATESAHHAGRLLIKSRDEYQVKLMPIDIQHREGADPTWADSFTKLLAFNQTQYDRVLSLDSDGTILQPMDELFLLPPCPVAMPRAYWLLDNDPVQRVLSSQLMLIQPDTVEFDRIVKKMGTVTDNDYDMEIVNQLYYDNALILPHRPYDMLTAEYRRTSHADYLGSEQEKWDPVAILNEAKFVHFSDWPIPKPWIPMPEIMREESQPDCKAINGKDDCIEREIWNKFYTDFSENRQRVCHSDAKPPHSKRRHWLRMEGTHRNK